LNVLVYDNSQIGRNSVNKGLDAIGIISRDMVRSVIFYGYLGVDLKEVGGADELEGNTDSGVPDHLEGMTDSGVRIMLDSVELTKKINPNWQAPSGTGVVLCFVQENSEKVNELYAKLIKAGFKSVKGPWDAFWGHRYASVEDPDGNQVDIFAEL